MTAPLPDQQPPSRAGSLSLLGGRLCLDFTNTSSGRGTPELLEHLREYRHLTLWAVHAEAIDRAGAERLDRAAAADPERAAEVVKRAIVFREALYRTLLALAGEDEPAAGDMDVINAEFQRAAAHGVLRPRGRGCVMGWDEADADPGAVLRPVVWSAAELLQAPDDLGRVKRCAACNCSWLFFDASKNRTRRWCTMNDCGNRAKARRHYQRRKLTDSPQSDPPF